MLWGMKGPLPRDEPRNQIERACARVGQCERLGLGDTERRQELIRTLHEVVARERELSEPLLTEVETFVTAACRGWERNGGLVWLRGHPEGWPALKRLVGLGAVPQLLAQLLNDYEQALRRARATPRLPRRKDNADEARPLLKAACALGKAALACEVANRAGRYIRAESIQNMWRLSQALAEVSDLLVHEDWPATRETVAIQRHVGASTSGYRDEQVSKLLGTVHDKLGRVRFRRSPESLERFRRKHLSLYEQPGQFDLSILLAGDRCASLVAVVDGRSRRRSAERLPTHSVAVSKRRARR
jgi:hypothetical protein